MDDIFIKLKKVMSNEEIHNLADLSVLKDQQGSYYLFDTYLEYIQI